MQDIDEHIQRCSGRIRDARRMADAFLDDDKLHQLATMTVFVLEDLLETLIHIRDRQRDGQS